VGANQLQDPLEENSISLAFHKECSEPESVADEVFGRGDRAIYGTLHRETEIKIKKTQIRARG
jgi:hypothetical protein